VSATAQCLLDALDTLNKLGIEKGCLKGRSDELFFTYEFGSDGHQRNSNDNDDDADPLIDFWYLVRKLFFMLSYSIG
jgi:hypothetical protein